MSSLSSNCGPMAVLWRQSHGYLGFRKQPLRLFAKAIVGRTGFRLRSPINLARRPNNFSQIVIQQRRVQPTANTTGKRKRPSRCMRRPLRNQASFGTAPPFHVPSRTKTKPDERRTRALIRTGLSPSRLEVNSTARMSEVAVSMAR